MSEIEYYTLYVKPTYCVSIPTYVKRKSKAPLRFNYEASNDKQVSTLDNLKDNDNNGILSKKAQQRIKNSVAWLVASARKKRVYHKASNKHFFYKLAFFTLTLPSEQKHSDNEIKSELLSKFLTYARNRWRMHNYIWRAEIQPKRLQKRGERCLHFHVTTDIFIHYKELNRVWNMYLKRLGYVGGGASTEIHSVRSVNNLGAYLAKYFSKDESGEDERLKVKGKLWGSSYSLSEKGLKMIMETRYPNEQLQKINECASTREKAIMSGEYQVGWLTMYREANLKTRAGNELKKMYTDKLFQIRYDPAETILFDSEN